MSAELKDLLNLIRCAAGSCEPGQLAQAASRILRKPVRIGLSETPAPPGALTLQTPDGRALGWLWVAAESPRVDVLANILALILDWSRHEEHRAELIAARTVLREMLPRNELRAGVFGAAGWLRASHYVGGDCFDFEQRGRALRFFLADAVGHGLASTMMSLECRALWRALSRSHEPVRVAALLNDLLSEEVRGGERFVTACLGEVDTESGELSFACCGMAPCFTFAADRMDVLETADPPLGVVPGIEYTRHVVPMGAGDKVLFVSDGVIEWPRADGQLFGSERVQEVLASGSEPLRRLNDALLAFADGTPQSDDAAALLLWREA